MLIKISIGKLATYRLAENRQNGDLKCDRSRLTMKLNDSRNAKFLRQRLLRYRIAPGDRVPLAVRDHLASRVMAIDNGLPTCEDNARIYRFYRVADARAITSAACWWIYNLFARAARRSLRELMAYVVRHGNGKGNYSTCRSIITNEKCKRGFVGAMELRSSVRAMEALTERERIATSESN